VAVALRQSMIELSNSRFVQQGQETKLEQVYKYLTGVKFRQRIEAVIEKFEDMRGDLDRERKFWASSGRSERRRSWRLSTLTWTLNSTRSMRSGKPARPI
jgi:hypothetical protein